MLSEQNFKQRQLLLSLQVSWLEFKEHSLQPGVDLQGMGLISIRLIDSEIKKLSSGPESWAKGRQDSSENTPNLTLS